MRILLLLTITSSFFSAFPVLAQVTGTVLENGTRVPVRGANVSWISAAGIKTTVTDSTGQFVFEYRVAKSQLKTSSDIQWENLQVDREGLRLRSLNSNVPLTVSIADFRGRKLFDQTQIFYGAALYTLHFAQSIPNGFIGVLKIQSGKESRSFKVANFGGRISKSSLGAALEEKNSIEFLNKKASSQSLFRDTFEIEVTGMVKRRVYRSISTGNIGEIRVSPPLKRSVKAEYSKINSANAPSAYSVFKSYGKFGPL